MANILPRSSGGFRCDTAHPTSGDPERGGILRVQSKSQTQSESTFQIRRARIKVGGHGYKSWLKYYFEYDWPSARLLDWRIMIEKYRWLQLRVGQWKINYNRERVDSSGQARIRRTIYRQSNVYPRSSGWSHGVWSSISRNPRRHVGITPEYLPVAAVDKINDDGRMLWMGRLTVEFSWDETLNFLKRMSSFMKSPPEASRLELYHRQS